MKFLLIIAILLFPMAIKADQDRFNTTFISKNGKYELNLKDLNDIKKLEWSLVEKVTGKRLYRFIDNLLWSMSVIISDDGKSIVAVDDYSTQDNRKNPEILHFFKNGKMLKSYKLSELLDNSRFITISASHFRWLNFYESSNKPYLVEDSKINLQTFELNNFTFDIETGNLLKKERDKIIDENTIYVFGQVSGNGSEDNEIEVFCSIYGNIPIGSKLKFVSKKLRWKGKGSFATLVIKNGELVEDKEILLNGCR
ncbi:MAG TPA: hypothetical protein PKY82_22785 [Pyrinomonadaceae bacterium]|nr:hypothetical protein [Pyrinomonadaceae bacterium]